MSEHYASGRWQVTEGKEEEFTARWNEFLGWTRQSYPELISAGLLQSTEDPSVFVSFAEWTDPAARAAWKASDGFAERFGACRALCTAMDGSDFNRVVTI